MRAEDRSRSFLTKAATLNTTGSLTVDVTTSIADFTQAENVTCDQLTIRLN
ncbi:MAG TPA: hypothetical protein VLT36_21445 [Candidatus Dormibacteraeota bacterium]|nr:hypothetical protein [Candidatus Dormibacteraeota bacterium]